MALYSTPGRCPSSIFTVTSSAQTASLPEDAPERSGPTMRHLGVAASFSAEGIEPYLDFWIQRLWPDCELEIAPYGQVLEQLCGPWGALYGRRDGMRRAGIVLLRAEDLLRGVDGTLLVDEAVLSRAQEHVREIANAISVPHGSECPLIVGGVPASERAERDPSIAKFVRWASGELAIAVRRAPTGHWLDLERVAALYEVREVHDPLRDELVHIPFTDEYMAALATTCVRMLNALWEPPRKAIVLDCDNTLWGGACGEEPLDALDTEGPYRWLREMMCQQARVGRLLCLASRNREVDVTNAFARCAAPLTLRQIAARRVSLGRKSESLLSLAEELGLSSDDFIFVDDDPVECAEVRAALPGVVVVELPREPQRIPRALSHVWEFDCPVVTEEDRHRTRFYALEARRRRERAAAPSLEAFVAALKVRVEVRQPVKGELARVAQLFARTNQFNLTGARCSPEQLSLLAERSDTELLVVRVSDRLGEYGLVGSLAVVNESPRICVPLLALSCRVLHRGVEGRILHEVARRAGALGGTEISIAFRPTARNRTARMFLDGLSGSDGRECVGEGHRYTWKLDELSARLNRVNPTWATGG